MASREEISARLRNVAKGDVYTRTFVNDRPLNSQTVGKKEFPALSPESNNRPPSLGGGDVGNNSGIWDVDPATVTGIARQKANNFDVTPAGVTDTVLADDPEARGFNLAKFLVGGVVKGADSVVNDLFAAPLDFMVSNSVNGINHVLEGEDWDRKDSNIFAKWHDKTKATKEQNEAYFAPNIEAGGKGAKVLDEINVGVTSAAPQALLALATAGGSLGAQGLNAAAQTGGGIFTTIKSAVGTMVKDPNYWISFFQTAGNSYDAAKADGASDTKASLYGIANGLLGSVVEVGGGGIQRLPKELQAGKSAIRQWINSSVDEGKEEVVQGVLERGLQNVIYQKGNALVSATDENAIINPKTSAKEFGMGATVGGILGGGQTLLSGAGRANNAMAAANGAETRATAPQDALYDTIVKDLNQSAVNAKGLKNADNGADSTTGGAASVPGEDALLAALTEKSGKRIDSLGSAKAGFDPLTAAGNKYGYVKESPDAARQNVYTPLQMDDDTRVTQTAQRLQEAAAIPEKYIPDIEKMIVNGDFSYTPDSNKEQVARAEKSISDKGWQTAVKDWTAQVRSGKAGGDLVAEGSVLLNNAANGGATAKEVVDLMLDQAQLMHNSGKSLQAGKILNRLTPEGKLYGMVKSVDDINQSISKEHPDIKISDDLVQQYRDAKTDAERNDIVGKIQKNIADQMPSTFMDKFTALRYLNMLGNFRTQVRNISGNAAMQVLRAAKDKVATLIELTANKASGGKVERTNVLAIKEPFYKFGAEDYHNIEKVAMGNGKYEDLSGSSFERGIQEQRTIFKSDDKFLNALLTPVESMRKATNWMMDKGDVPFSKHTYARNLGGYLQAQGITEEQLRTGDIDEKVLDRAREHAIKESQDATFRDNNTFSDWVSRIGRTKNTPKAANVLSEGVSPFRRTPANVAVRGVEYSPIGLVKGAIETTMAASGKGTVDINAAINNLSKGITGTGVLGLGFALAAEGFLHGAGDGDDKKNRFDKNMGVQDYSLVMPDGTTYTIDWASPAAMPLFVGANIYQMSQDKNMTLKDFFGALGQITDPLINMSMLSGVNDAINAVRYSDGSPVENIAINAATNYLTQGLTSTLLGQIERSTEDNRKSTHVDKNSELPDSLQRLLGKTSAKTPGWDFSQYDYIDLWGNSQSNGSPAERTLMNFLSPGYSSKMDKSAVNMEVQRLHDATGEASVLPTAAGKSITEGGEKTDFTKDQFVTYATTLGKTRYDVIDDMIKSDTYKKASDSEKVELIGDAYAYAAKVAKAKVSGGELDSAAQKAKDFSGGAAVYILYSAAAAKCEGTKDANGETVSGSKRAEVAGKINEMRLTDAQKYELYFSGSEGETEKEALKNAKIPYEKFAAYKSKVSALTADKDKNGNAITGSLKKKVMQTIQNTGLSAPQKDALYYAAGYKQTTLAKDAPWR